MHPFRLCFNTSNIRGAGVPLDRAAAIASHAGFDGIEPWIDEIERYAEEGGVLSDLASSLTDIGISVEGAIGFFDWIVDDDSRRAAGLAEARRCMELVRAIGGKRIAAPPMGAQEIRMTNLDDIADRYSELLAVGVSTGVTPVLEFWGFSRTLSTLDEAIDVCVRTAREDACMLMDIYHLHRGGSGFSGVHMVGARGIGMFHVNDYPRRPAARELNDGDRVMPGDGVAPLADVFRTLRDNGYRGPLSLELFREDLWQRPPDEVAREGYRKLTAAIDAALKPPAR